MKKLNTALQVAVFFFCFSPLFAGPLAEYNLNTYNSLVQRGSRCVGMGGAVVALGDEADDLFYNAAAAARRNKYQISKLEWDYTFSFMNLFGMSENDFRNLKGVFPDYRNDDFTYFAVALEGIYNRFALSATFDIVWNTLKVSGDSYNIVQYTVGINFAWAVVPGQLYVGIGALFPAFEFEETDGMTLAEYDYSEDRMCNWQIGAIWTPAKTPLSFGINLHVNQNGTENELDKTVVIDLPKLVYHPTVLRLGAAWKIGISGDADALYHIGTNNRKTARRLFRLTPEYILLSASCAIVGTVDNALDIASFADGSAVLRSGEKVLIEPAFGVECSFPTWLKLRLGYYHEAPRVSGTAAREHFTANMEARVIRLFGYDLSVSFTMDWSRDLWSAGVGAKIWKY